MNKIVIIILCAGLMLSCNTEKKVEKAPSVPTDNSIVFTKKQFVNMKLEMGSLEQQIMDINIDANGVVDVPPDQMFSVNYQMNGVITSINHNLLPGKYIKKGEQLAQIQSLDLLQTEEDYLNEIIKSEWYNQEYERQKALLADDATAKRKFQEIENTIKLSKVKTKSLSEKLKVLGVNPASLNSSNISPKHTLVAKQSGFVKAVNIINGSSFTKDETLFELISTQHIHVELKVFGNDMLLVKEGQNVDFITPSGKIVVGKIHLIDRTVDVEQKSLNLHVHITDEAYEQSLRPGQFISGSINVQNSKVMALPESAILTNTDGSFIFRMTEGKDQVKFEKIEVKTGRMAHGFVEIIEPKVIEGKIVVRGVSFVENGASEE
jgi:cobalt-zinc-cadmium efflux system membrane fusion protein